MGLVGLNTQWPPTRWLSAAGTGLGLGLATGLCLLIAWLQAGARTNSRLYFANRPWWLWTLDILVLEVHWAFYRAALGDLLDQLYVGILLSLAVIYAEWALDPAWRAGWREASSATWQWLRSALAVAMGLGFLLTRNLWICLLVHALLEFGLWQVGQNRGQPQTA
jgi:hypothetical protein